MKCISIRGAGTQSYKSVQFYSNRFIRIFYSNTSYKWCDTDDTIQMIRSQQFHPNKIKSHFNERQHLGLVIMRVSYLKMLIRTYSFHFGHCFFVWDLHIRAVARSENPGGLVVLRWAWSVLLVEIGLTVWPKTGGAIAPPRSRRACICMNNKP